MKKIVAILSFVLLGLNSFSQTDSISNTSIKGNIICVNPSIPVEICYPIGIKFIAGSEKPNFGLNIDYMPPFFHALIGQLGFRSDFHNNHILNTSIEKRFIFKNYLKYLGFKFTYDYFELENLILTDYRKYTLGPTYIFKKAYLGCFVGQDKFENEIGVDVLFKYNFPSLVSNSNYTSKAVISTQFIIGFWDNVTNYDLKLDYKINSKYECGLGYKKLYDFKDLYFTFRYSLCQ